jgi:hypothetical protein
MAEPSAFATITSVRPRERPGSVWNQSELEGEFFKP